MTTPSPRASMLAVAAIVAAATGFLLLRMFDPNAAGSPFPPCIFRSLTGLYCPGCGITRMLHALAHGDIARAARMNAMVLAMLPALALMLANELGSRRFLPAALARPLYSAPLWLAVVVAFGVLRNLPGFGALAPG